MSLKRKPLYLFPGCFLVALAAAIPLFNVSEAQESLRREAIHNRAQNEDRVLEIILPGEHKADSENKYPVVYVLDGGWHTSLVSFIYNFAVEEGLLPPAIIVGIPNLEIEGQSQRNRDLLPAQGADKFLAFIENDVIPFIEKNYPANGKRTLYGHSYGGLFSTYAFLSRPGVFDAYMAIDPPYQGNHRLVMKKAEERLGRFSCAGKRLWIAGIEATHKKRSIAEMDSLLRARVAKELNWQVGLYASETHRSVALKGAYDGFKYLHRKPVRESSEQKTDD
jgi:predicted alpha/beta superfamily hydrolase